jgi:hypothetical protein
VWAIGCCKTALVNKVQPVHQQLAKQARVQGIVLFQAIICKDGHIVNLQSIDSHPLLVLVATTQRVYKPSYYGDPVEVVTQIDLKLTLRNGAPSLPPPGNKQETGSSAPSTAAILQNRG